MAVERKVEVIFKNLVETTDLFTVPFEIQNKGVKLIKAIRLRCNVS